MKIIIPHILSTYILTNWYREQNSLIGRIMPFLGIVSGLFFLIMFGDIMRLFVISVGLLLLYVIVPCAKFGISKRYYKITESYTIFEKDGISHTAGGYTLTLKKDIIDTIIITKKYLRIKVIKGQDLYVLIKDQKREEVIPELKNLDYKYIIK